MYFIEKIVLMIIVYMLIGITALGAAIAYLATKDFISMMLCFIIIVLFYTLGLIEEQ